MNNTHSMLIVAVIAAVTLLLRVLPFFIFGSGKKTPAYITYMGNVLPFALMGMLIVFCLKNVSVIQPPHGIPELISAVAVVVLHVWKRNTLISILCGTVCYMLLIQLVF